MATTTDMMTTCLMTKALKAVIPYALSRAEDMDEAGGRRICAYAVCAERAVQFASACITPDVTVKVLIDAQLEYDTAQTFVDGLDPETCGDGCKCPRRPEGT